MYNDVCINWFDCGVKKSKVISGKNVIFENSWMDLNQTWYKYVSWCNDVGRDISVDFVMSKSAVLVVSLFRVTLWNIIAHFLLESCPFLWYWLPSYYFIPIYGTSLLILSKFAFLRSTSLILQSQTRLNRIHLHTICCGHLSINAFLPQPSPPYLGCYLIKGLSLHSSSGDYLQLD